MHFLLHFFQLDGELRYVLLRSYLERKKITVYPEKVGVVLINCNGGKVTIPCIQSLLSGSMKPDRIVVVDNASSDGSEREIAERFPDVQLIRNKENIGFAAGNNVGISELLNRGCKYIWVLNNDTELQPDCLKIQYDFMESKPATAGCCAKILYSLPQKTIWYAGERFNAFTLRIRHRGILEEDGGQYDVPLKVLFMTGCSMFVRSEAWEKVKDFNEKFFVYYEDLDWCLRARKEGLEFWYLPKAVVFHKVSATFGNKSGKQSPFVTPPRVAYLVQRNQIFIIKRWKSRPGFLFLLFFLEIPRLLYYSIGLIFLGRIDNLLALWRGMRDGLFN